MKGAEVAVKWKEVKGHARKLRGKGDERTGRGGLRFPRAIVDRSVFFAGTQDTQIRCAPTFYSGKVSSGKQKCAVLRRLRCQVA